MSEEMFGECAPVAWQLLLEPDRELSACAASLFILAAVKAPQTASEIMHNDLKHTDPSVRLVPRRKGITLLTIISFSIIPHAMPTFAIKY